MSYNLNLFQVTVADRMLMREYAQADITALQNPAPPRIQEEPSEGGCSVAAEVHPSAGGNACHNSACVRQFFFFKVLTFTDVSVCILSERLLCVLEELHTLSTSMVNSSEDSAEEEDDGDSVRPDIGS